jgi:hypothetical protein
MAKMTKTECKNSLKAIKAKAFKLLGSTGNHPIVMSVADYSAIEKIVSRNLKKLG